MGHLNVLEVNSVPHKSCRAVALLANQLWCPVSIAEVVLQVLLASKLLSTVLLPTTERLYFEVNQFDVCLQVTLESKLLSTVLLHTTEGLFIEVHKLDVFGQDVATGKLSSALGIIAHQLLFPMSC